MTNNEVVDIEQTLEALDRAVRIATAYSSMLETGSSIEQRAQARDDKKAPQSLRDSLPQLLADAEAFRKMKEHGPVAFVDGHAFGRIMWIGVFPPKVGTRLYVLPDTKENES